MSTSPAHDAETAAASAATATALDLVLEVTRSLLWITSRLDGRDAAVRLVTGVGAHLVPVADADHTCLPVDVSFGEGVAMVPSAPPGSAARTLLERHLPGLVVDINRAIALAAEIDRLQEDATVDSLTGLPNRRHLGRALGRLRVGDVVIMLDLDHFKQLNDTLGHPTGDTVLRVFGETLRTSVRARDVIGRYGGEEFVIILGGGDAEAFLSRLRRRWLEDSPHPVTFTAGMVQVASDSTSGVVATAAADRAMYRAKRAGRDRWLWADADDLTTTTSVRW